MGRRRTRVRAEKTRTEKDWQRQGIRDHVAQLMQHRMFVRCPPPIPAEIVHYSAFTPEVRAALRTLHDCGLYNTNSNAVKLERESYINIESWDIAGVSRIKLQFNEPLIGTFSYWGSLPVTKLPEPVQAKLLPWAVEWRRLSNEAAEMKNLVTELCDICGTIPQIVRVWPQLIGFCAAGVRDNLALQKKAPRFPDAIVDSERKLLLLWQPETLKRWDEPLAEALLLEDSPADQSMVLM